MRRYEGLASVAMCAAALSFGCTDGASDNPAYGSSMRVEGAQFVPGNPPSPSGGPGVAALELATNTVWPGYSNKLIQGALGASATSAAIGLRGDQGYWIVVAGAPDVSTPTLPSFSAVASFAADLLPGTYELQVRAVDSQGGFGPPSKQLLTAEAAAPSMTVTGDLVVTLRWDTESDLDLHVVDPAGNEIFHGAPSSEDAFSSTPSAGASAGVLDADSNAQCVIDGRRQEDVTWASEPPRGHYVVRVDTTSLCGQPTAHYSVQATLHGASVGEASGVALDQDTWGAHDRGAGILVLAFDVP